MGSCGCGNANPYAKLPGPDGVVYLLEFYTGCRDCDSGAGYVIHKLPVKEAQEFEFDRLPEAQFVGPDEWQDHAVPVVDISSAGARKQFDAWLNGPATEGE